LSGKPPFAGASKEDIYDSIKNKEPYFGGSIWDKVSKDAKEFVKLCLRKDGDKRPSSEDLLNTNWIKNKTNIKIDSHV